MSAPSLPRARATAGFGRAGGRPTSRHLAEQGAGRCGLRGRNEGTRQVPERAEDLTEEQGVGAGPVLGWSPAPLLAPRRPGSWAVPTGRMRGILAIPEPRQWGPQPGVPTRS